MKNLKFKILPITDFKAKKKDGKVTISGYANTKNHADRYGDVPTVLTDLRDYVYDLSEFKTNPVMLMDHDNRVERIAGSFTTFKEDEKGLYVEGTFSASDLPAIKHARDVYSEGHAKALSMAGQFYFENEDVPQQLTLAKIYEISLVGVPADPNSLVNAGKNFKREDLKEAEIKETKEEPTEPVKTEEELEEPVKEPKKNLDDIFKSITSFREIESYLTTRNLTQKEQHCIISKIKEIHGKEILRSQNLEEVGKTFQRLIDKLKNRIVNK